MYFSIQGAGHERVIRQGMRAMDFHVHKTIVAQKFSDDKGQVVERACSDLMCGGAGPNLLLLPVFT